MVVRVKDEDGWSVGVGYKSNAGLFAIYKGIWAFHLFPSVDNWHFGHDVEEYDMCMDYWGMGPLFLVCRMNE